MAQDPIFLIDVDRLRLHSGHEWRVTGDLTTLAEDIRSHGVLKPLDVAREGGDHYLIGNGARRWQAAQMVGLKTVPCRIINYDGLDPLLDNAMTIASVADARRNGKVTDDDLRRMRSGLIDRLVDQINERGEEVDCGRGEQE